jgi:hypothetical protein
MRTTACTTILLCVLRAAAACAQTMTTEASVTVGRSSEDGATAAATQLRAFGTFTHGIRFFSEASWGTTSEREVDAFGAAYPYGNRIQVIEAYAERTFLPGRGIVALKAGRYRPPFGISSGSDHAYNGFLRPPLMRYDDYFSISNNFLENGVDLLAGTPRLSLESSLGAPGVVGVAERRAGLDTVLRLQAYAGPLIAGASYIHTRPYQSPVFAKGYAEFRGLDFRVSHAGVELRGELIDGRPFNGTTTAGWYVDTLLHRPGMGPLTAVARVEDLAYVAIAPFDIHARRQTVGARVRIAGGLSLQANVLHQTGAPAEYGARALDVGVTYSVRRTVKDR